MRTIESNPQTEEQVTRLQRWELSTRTNMRLLIIAVVAVLVAGAYFGFVKLAGSDGIRREGWQAVFLDNGQVYFGKLSIDSDFYVLSDIYYLQAEQTVLGVDTTAGSADNQQAAAKKQNTRLVKFGNELHGPEDEMHIERSKILFWENMKDESNVVKAIQESKTQLTK